MARRALDTVNGTVAPQILGMGVRVDNGGTLPMLICFASRLGAAAGFVALSALPVLASDGLDTGDTA